MAAAAEEHNHAVQLAESATLGASLVGHSGDDDGLGAGGAKGVREGRRPKEMKGAMRAKERWAAVASTKRDADELKTPRQRERAERSVAFHRQLYTRKFFAYLTLTLALTLALALPELDRRRPRTP